MMMGASQVAPGKENRLQLRVDGTTGGLHWRQRSRKLLRFARFGEPPKLITRGGQI